jgi:hypothetical protein
MDVAGIAKVAFTSEDRVGDVLSNRHPESGATAHNGTMTAPEPRTRRRQGSGCRFVVFR